MTYSKCFTDLNHLNNIEIFESKLHSITCNNCHLIDCYKDDLVILDDLNKDESLMIDSNAIHIRLQDLEHIISFEKALPEISQLSILENKAISINQTPCHLRLTLFVKILATEIFGFKTGYHQFSISPDDTYSDLLHNILIHHQEENMYSEHECSLLMTFDWNAALYSDENCIPKSRIGVKLVDQCIFIPGKQYVLFKVLTYGKKKNPSMLHKDAFQILMNSSKEFVLPPKKNSNNFPNKLYNHIIDIYETNNLYVDKTSLSLLV